MLPEQDPPFSMRFLRPDSRKAVIVERIVAGHEPDYPIHGRTRCMVCDNWCWLGAETLGTIERLEAVPWCQQCALDAEFDDSNFLGMAQ